MEEKYQREYDIIRKTGSKPILARDLKRAFSELGIQGGQTILAHASLSKIGFLLGGSATLIRSLMQAVGTEGLIAMPAHSNDLSDPADWENPPVPEEWKPLIRQNMPAYDPAFSSAARLGRTAEHFRCLPGVSRSPHPLLSMAAWGRGAEELTREHPLDYPNGIHGPLGKLYKARAHIILYGVNYNSCTALHLAEYLSNWKDKGYTADYEYAPTSTNEDGTTKWQKLKEVPELNIDFQEIGTAFEAQEPQQVKKVQLCLGEIRSIPMPALVHFATNYIDTNLNTS